jgi:hypothetical protein
LFTHLETFPISDGFREPRKQKKLNWFEELEIKARSAIKNRFTNVQSNRMIPRLGDCLYLIGLTDKPNLWRREIFGRILHWGIDMTKSIVVYSNLSI